VVRTSPGAALSYYDDIAALPWLPCPPDEITILSRLNPGRVGEGYKPLTRGRILMRQPVAFELNCCEVILGAKATLGTGKRVVETPSKADNYRETASTLRGFAEGMNPGDPQTEIIELAERFERLAEHVERRSPTST